jgi:hypothetical protein
MSEERITINGVEYVRADSVSQKSGPWSMFIIDNGWIIIGKSDGINGNGGRVILNPWCVRSYGEGDGITAVTDPGKCTYEKWPGDRVVIDRGRTVSVTELPESFDGPR